MTPVEQAFAAHAPYLPGRGEALCLWQQGCELAHYCSGESRPGVAWTPHTLVPIFSATKPLSAACLLLALHDCGQGPDLAVGELWPAFPAPHCSIAHLLSHQTGLAAWAQSAPIGELRACCTAVEASSPAWAPPQHGYHPHTIGPMVDYLMLQLTGRRVGEFWEHRVRRPLGLEVYIGAPEAALPRVAELHMPRLQGAMPKSEFYREYFDPASPVYRAFHSVSGIDSARAMNNAAALQCACPARGGVASARGLAMAYQALLGVLPGSPFPAAVLRWLSQPRCAGWDLTLRCHTAFTCGAMCEPAELFGRGGFGHAGAGGCHAFAEPGSACSFAYVLNGLQLGVLPGERVLNLISACSRS